MESLSYSDLLDMMVDLRDRENAFDLPKGFRKVYESRLARLKYAMAKELNCSENSLGLLPETTTFHSSETVKAFKELKSWVDSQFQQIEKAI